MKNHSLIIILFAVTILVSGNTQAADNKWECRHVASSGKWPNNTHTCECKRKVTNCKPNPPHFSADAVNILSAKHHAGWAIRTMDNTLKGTSGASHLKLTRYHSTEQPTRSDNWAVVKATEYYLSGTTNCKKWENSLQGVTHSGQSTCPMH